MAMTLLNAAARIRWVLAAFSARKGDYGVVIGGQVATHAVGLVLPLVSMAIVDRVVPSGSQASLVALVLLIAGAHALGTVLTACLGSLYTAAGLSATGDIAMHVNEKLLSLPLSHFHGSAVGDNIARLNELDKVKGFIDTWVFSRSVELLFALIYVIVMLALSPLLTVVALGIVPVHTVIYAAFNRRTRTAVQGQFNTSRDYQALLIEVLNGIETIKSFSAERRITDRLARHFGHYLAAVDRLAATGRRTALVVGFATIGFEAASLYLGITEVIGGAMTLGALFAFQMVAGKAVSPLQASTSVLQEVAEVRNAIDRLSEILDAPPAWSAPVAARAVPGGPDAVLIARNVSVGFSPEAPPILVEVDLQVPQGARMALVGPSGAGKSTLARSLAGLLPPDAGDVTLHSQEGEVLAGESLRARVLYIPQHADLFKGTVFENITFFDGEGCRVRADRALKAMCLAELGTHRPVLDHGVEEGGRNLSGGQRQRLVLARALYHRPDFLILDEATSALDPELEKSVFNTLMAELPDAAIVFITHRLSLAMTAETISMLEHGRMVYSGARHPAGAVSERFTQYIQSNQP